MAKNFGRVLVVVAGLVGCAISPVSADASTITYDLTLSPLFPGGVGGSGTLIVDGTSGNDVTELDITMSDGVVFDFIGQNLKNASATVLNGNLVDLEGSDTAKSGKTQYSLDLSSNWFWGLEATFSDGYNQDTFELVSAVDPPAPAPTPLPPTWTMMLIGIVAFGIFVGRGTRRNSDVFAVG